MPLTLDDIVVKHSTEGTLWRDGEPTPRGVHVYSMGDCWALAWEVAAQARLDLAVLTDDDGSPLSIGWNHVLAKVDDELYLDVFGLQDRAQIEADWGGVIRDLEPTETFHSYRELLRTDWAFEEDRPAAKAMAKALVLKYL